MKPVDFIRDFIKYADKVGIYDEYDKDSNKMVTSAGMTALIKQARECLPEKIGNLEAARRMRDLTDDERDKLIADADVERIVDMRKEFQLKMSANGGAMGLIEKLVEATDNGEYDAVVQLMVDAHDLVKGPENIS